MLTIGENLLAAQSFLLKSPEAILLLLLFASHLGFTHLHLTLVHNCTFLFLAESLKVVGLDTVRGKHRLLCLRVLSHKVVVVGMIDISASLKLFVLRLSSISIALLFSSLCIGILNRFLHGEAISCMIFLGLC